MDKIRKYVLSIPKIMLIMIIISVALCGCGELSTKQDLLEYSEENYGKCKLISSSESEDENTVIVEDDEYEFEYETSSYMDKITVDGSYFGSLPSTKSTFIYEYLKCFENKHKNKLEKIKDKYECNIEINKNFNPKIENDVIIYVYSNKNKYNDIIKNISKYIKEFDTREYLADGIIYIEKDNEFVGQYSLKEQKYQSKSDYEQEWALNNAAQIMEYDFNLNITDINELEFLYSETVDVKDIYGIEDKELSYRLDKDTDESLKHTKVWHYEYKNDEWIIADCIVKPYGHLYVTKLNK